MTRIGSYPTRRMRRARRDPIVRELFAEHALRRQDLIYPLFVSDGDTESLESLPGIRRLSVKDLVAEGKIAWELGVKAIMVFPYIEASLKDALGSEALREGNLVCRALHALKEQCPQLMVICDVALDPYTSHGHDGVLADGQILNDPTLDQLCAQALLLARNGADVLAPSDMMDGRVGALRAALDKSGFVDMPLFSYAAKYASSLYGPFRQAVGSGGALVGDKRTYQLDARNREEALHEIGLDLEEGADAIIIKPALPYLDIIERARRQFGMPTIAYHVSGEYAMWKAAAERGFIDGRHVMLELMIALKRAGCHAVISYAAKEIAGWLDD